MRETFGMFILISPLPFSVFLCVSAPSVFNLLLYF
jgi:hypothetical protein